MSNSYDKGDHILDADKKLHTNQGDLTINQIARHDWLLTHDHRSSPTIEWEKFKQLMKSVNDELHMEGGVLAGRKDLQVTGTDGRGNLLITQKNEKANFAHHKYIVNRNGNVVASLELDENTGKVAEHRGQRPGWQVAPEYVNQARNDSQAKGSDSVSTGDRLSLNIDFADGKSFRESPEGYRSITSAKEQVYQAPDGSVSATSREPQGPPDTNPGYSEEEGRPGGRRVPLIYKNFPAPSGEITFIHPDKKVASKPPAKATTGDGTTSQIPKGPTAVDYPITRAEKHPPAENEKSKSPAVENKELPHSRQLDAMRGKFGEDIDKDPQYKNFKDYVKGIVGIGNSTKSPESVIDLIQSMPGQSLKDEKRRYLIFRACGKADDFFKNDEAGRRLEQQFEKQAAANPQSTGDANAARSPQEASTGDAKTAKIESRQGTDVKKDHPSDGNGDRVGKISDNRPEPRESAEVAAERLGRLQDGLIAWLPLIESTNAGKGSDSNKGQTPDNVERLQEQIRAEKANGTFGPGSLEAYKRVVEHVNKTTPQLVETFSRLALPLPAGCPISEPVAGKSGSVSDSPSVVAAGSLNIEPAATKPVPASDNPAVVVAGSLSLEPTAGSPTTAGKPVAAPDSPPVLPVDVSRAPNAQEQERLGNSLSWIIDANNALKPAVISFASKNLVQDFQKWGHPELKPPAEVSKLEDWYAAAKPIDDLSKAVQGYAGAIASLHHAGNNFPDQALSQENFPGKITIDKQTGRITDIQIDLPQDLRQTPENQAKIKRIEQWLETNSGPVNQALAAYVGSINNRENIVMYGELPISGSVGLRTDGTVLSDSTKGTEKAAKNEPFNLMEYKFDAETLPDGKIKVTTNCQYKNSRMYNYLNIGAQDVGQAVIESKTYKPDEFVAVCRQGQVELMRADSLVGWTGWKNSSRAEHYAGKTGTAIADTAMTFCGVEEFAAAWRAGRLAEVGADQALKKVVQEQVNKELLAGGFHASLGGSGFLLNNAGVSADPVWRTVAQGRNLVMVTDITRNLIKSGLRTLRPAEASENQSVIELMQQGKESFLKSPLGISTEGTGLGWKKVLSDGLSVPLKAADKATGAAFITTDAIFLPMMAGDSYALLKRAQGYNPQDDTQFAYSQVMKAPEVQLSKTVPDKINAGPLPEKAGLTNLTSTLLLEPTASAPAVLAALEKCQQGMSLPQDSGARLECQSDLCRTFRAATSDKERLAAGLGLLYLAAKPNGSIPEQLGSAGVIPGAIPGHVTPVTSKEILNFVEKQAASSNSPADRLVAGDVLLRLGRISARQYAGMCQDVLENKNSSDELKARAILDPYSPRLAVLIDTLEAQDKAGGGDRSANSYGLSTSDLKATLTRISSDRTTAQDLRAMASETLTAIEQKDAAERAQQLQTVMTKWQQLSSQPGAFFQDFVQSAKRDLETKPEGEDADYDNKVRRQLESAKAVSASAPDSVKPEEVSAVLTRSTNRYNPELAIKAIGALADQDLSKLPPAEVSKLRQQVLSVAGASKTASTAERANSLLQARQKAIEVVPKLFANASEPERKAAEVALAGLITPSCRSYQSESPDTRLRAVTALSNFHTDSTQASLKPLLDPANEPSAPVRLEAWKVLAQLNPTDASNLAQLHRASEQDQSIASYLDSLIRLNQTDTTASKISSSDQGIIADPATTAMLKWLKVDHPLLFADEATKELHSIEMSLAMNLLKDVTGVSGNYVPGFGTPKAMWDTQDKVETQGKILLARCEAQFDDLVAKAQLTGDDGHNARLALAYMVASGAKLAFQGQQEAMANQAAQALLGLCSPGVPERMETALLVQRCMRQSEGTSARAQLQMLQSFDALTRSQQPAFDDATASETLFIALQQESRRRLDKRSDDDQNSEMLQAALLKRLSQYQGPRITAYLQELADNYPSESIRKLAAGYLHQRSSME